MKLSSLVKVLLFSKVLIRAINTSSTTLRLLMFVTFIYYISLFQSIRHHTVLNPLSAISHMFLLWNRKVLISFTMISAITILAGGKVNTIITDNFSSFYFQLFGNFKRIYN